MTIVEKPKKSFAICVANEWIDKDPFMSFKVKIRETNRSYLLQDELDKIIALKFTADRLTQSARHFCVLLLHWSRLRGCSEIEKS
jgi:hypothetical protein